MTEIVAAHLERVARELSESVVRALFDQGYLAGPTQDRLDAEGIAGEALKAGLAAALAACAREAELKVARRIQTEVNWAVTMKTPSRVGSVAKWLDEHIAALERAVGEKVQ